MSVSHPSNVFAVQVLGTIVVCLGIFCFPATIKFVLFFASPEQREKVKFLFWDTSRSSHKQCLILYVQIPCCSQFHIIQITDISCSGSSLSWHCKRSHLQWKWSRHFCRLVKVSGDLSMQISSQNSASLHCTWKCLKIHVKSTFLRSECLTLVDRNEQMNTMHFVQI